MKLFPGLAVSPLLLAGLFAAVKIPHISSIDYYGLHRVSQKRVQKVLGLKDGDPMPPSKGVLEDRLEKVPGVVLGRIEAVCCERGGAMLFVGIEEKGAPHFSFHSAPAGDAALSAAMVEKYGEFVRALEQAAREGRTEEDLTQGHPLSADPDVREIQRELVSLAKVNLNGLRNVLRQSSSGEQRAMAATFLGYAPDKKSVVNDLEYGLQDPDPAVRGNAIRALGAIAVLAVREPDRHISIPPIWFIEMLNSIFLSDRYKAALALVDLTATNAADTLSTLRERALASLVEMAQWKSLRYALPAYILLGRIGGLSQRQIEDTWSRGDRVQTIYQIVNGGRKKK